VCPNVGGVPYAPLLGLALAPADPSLIESYLQHAKPARVLTTGDVVVHHLAHPRGDLRWVHRRVTQRVRRQPRIPALPPARHQLTVAQLDLLRGPSLGLCIPSYRLKACRESVPALPWWVCRPAAPCQCWTPG
jgi:hypothetical protein